MPLLNIAARIGCLVPQGDLCSCGAASYSDSFFLCCSLKGLFCLFPLLLIADPEPTAVSITLAVSAPPLSCIPQLCPSHWLSVLPHSAASTALDVRGQALAIESWLASNFQFYCLSLLSIEIVHICCHTWL